MTSAAHTVKDSRSSEESKQTLAVLGSRGEKPAAAISPDASQCDSEGATGSASQSSAAMTHDQRTQLRHLIDQAKRQQLDAHKQPPGRNQEARRATYRAYYQRNRARILARRVASRAA